MELLLQPLHPPASNALLQHTGGQRKQQCCLEERKGLGTAPVQRCHGTAVVSVPNSCDIKQSNPSPSMLVSCASLEHHESVFREEMGKPGRETHRVGPTNPILVTGLEGATSVTQAGDLPVPGSAVPEWRSSCLCMKRKKYPAADIAVFPPLIASGC